MGNTGLWVSVVAGSMVGMGEERTASGLRRLAAPFVVAAPSGVSTRDRLRPTSDEAAALAEIGEFLGGLYRADYAERAAAGRLDAQGRAESRRERKRALTAASSSRWAGAITRRSEDQYNLGMRTLYDHRASLRWALETLDQRLALAPGEVVTNRWGHRVRGYRNGQEWFAKTRRRAILADRLNHAEARIQAAAPRLVHGSSRLWRNRHHLDQAGLTEQQWRRRWDASRWFLTADGETGAKYGNLTIRVDPDGHVSVKVPTALVPRFGTHLRLAVPVNLATHRAGEWADRINSNRAVGYRIAYDVESGRWYLHASWTYPTQPQPTLNTLRQARTLAVDVNGDHLAAWVTDPAGNPVATPITIPLQVEGPATLRDAYLRHGITRLIHTAKQHGCAAITIENLGFDDARASGRETMGRGRRGKRFRRTVAGIPTGQFRNRLVAMTAEHGLSVIAVDPAYTSRWGGQHWRKPLTQQTRRTDHHASGPAVTRHHAAAVVIGRRGHGHSARRRAPGTPTTTEDVAGPTPTPTQAPEHRARGHVTTGNPPPRRHGQEPDASRGHANGYRGPTPFGATRAGLTPAHYLGTVM